MDTIWQDIWQKVCDDFSVAPRAGVIVQFVLRLLVAAILGGMLGYTRELLGKEAGMRTHMLVGMGAAFFMATGHHAGMANADLSRVMAGVLTGIGFLGGGVILKLASEKEIHGLTTAAGIWFTAAVGVGVGMGQMMTAIAGAVLGLAVLTIMRKIERRIRGRHSDSG